MRLPNILSFLKMKIKILTFVFGIILPSLIFAKTPEERMKAANDAYRINHFKDASETYESLLKEGYSSAELYYNMGNTYYRMNKIPKAILYYEKAKLLMPGDEDLDNNLKIANLSVTDKNEILPELAIIRYFNNFISIRSSSGWIKISIFFLWFALVSTAIYLLLSKLLFRKIGFYSGILFMILSISTYIFGNFRNQLENKKFAIIFSEVAYIKTSPEDNGKDAFYLHSGTKVQIKETLGDWINIRLSDGKTGWMKKDEVEII